MIPNRFSKKYTPKTPRCFSVFFVFPLPGLPKKKPKNSTNQLDPWPDLDPIQERRALFAPESPSRCPQGMGNPPAARKVMTGCFTFGEEQKTTWKRGDFYQFEPLCLKMFIIILFHSKSSSFLVPLTKDTKLWNVGMLPLRKNKRQILSHPLTPTRLPFVVGVHAHHAKLWSPAMSITWVQTPNTTVDTIKADSFPTG